MEKLKNVDFKLVIFLLLCVAAPIVSPSIMAPVCVLALATLVGIEKHYKENSKPDLDAEVKKELMGIKSQMSGLVVKSSMKQEPAEFKRFF
jgi:hypothetical protein